MSGEQRWLWLTAELPGASDTGRLVYSGGLIRALADSGVEMTVVGFGAPPPDVAHVDWRAVPGSTRGGVASIASSLPNLAYACSSATMRRAVGEALAERWDVVVIDHLQMGWAAGEAGIERAGAVVFVTHNHEATVRSRVAREARGPKRVVLWLDARKAARLERRVASAVDVVTSITQEDASAFRGQAAGASHVVIPPGWSGEIPQSIPPIASRGRRVGVLGSFVWHVKQENLRQFLAVADQVYADAGIELVVGGTVADDLVAELEPTLRATRFVGWVADAPAFLQTCRIGLVAEPLGGGFKLKTLDYVFSGVPVAAVRGSVAGLPLTHGTSMIEAPDHESLARATADVIDDAERLESMAAAAMALCTGEFTWSSRATTLRQTLDDIPTRCQ